MMMALAQRASTNGLTASEFAAAVQRAEGDHLIVFGASWCRPAHRIEQHLARIATRHPIGTWAVDVEQSPEIASSYGVSAVPTLLLFRNGQMAARRLGELSEQDIADWILM